VGCGCGQHLEARGEEALIVRVIYHLEVEHPEAHFSLEQAEEFVATEAYEAL
jgi:predicted small metal-binding protein